MYLRDLQLAASRDTETIQCVDPLEFDCRTVCVTESLIHAIRARRIATNCIGKVFVLAKAQLAVEHEALWPEPMLKVFELAQRFPFEQYSQATPVQRAELICQAFQNALLYLAAREGWEQAPIDHAVREVKQTGYVHSIVGKAKPTPRKGWYYRLRATYGFETFQLQLELLQPRAQVVANYQLLEIPCILDAARLHGDAVSWADEDTFTYTSAIRHLAPVTVSIARG